MKISAALVACVACVALAAPIVAGAQSSGRAATATPALVPINDGGLGAVVAQHIGQVVIVDFWATWCAPCREELPGLVALERRLRSRGVRFLTVSTDDSAQIPEAIAFLDSVKAPVPRYIKRATSDERFINAIDSSWSGALPALFVYDRAGRRVASFIGETPIAKVEAAIHGLRTPRQ